MDSPIPLKRLVRCRIVVRRIVSPIPLKRLVRCRFVVWRIISPIPLKRLVRRRRIVVRRIVSPIPIRPQLISNLLIEFPSSDGYKLHSISNRG
jgi:hypothetical protein